MAKGLEKKVADLILNSGAKSRDEILSFVKDLMAREDVFLKEVGKITVECLSKFADGEIDRPMLEHTLTNIKRLLDSHARYVSAKSKDKFSKIAKSFGLRIVKELIVALV